jgi:hypothetical protein
MSALALSITVALVCAPLGRPVLNEVLYDAVGDDVGREYVELLNTADAAWSLEGLRIEAGDGAAPGRWTLRWTGRPGDSVAAHTRFVIGGANVSPAVQRVVNLDLQNGPDAVRLVWPDGVTEVLGWGELAADEYHCGVPAPDVPSGRSLARIPESAATADNAGDFREASPSPGAPNVRTRDAAVVAHGIVLDPEQPSSGGDATLTVRVADVGATAWAAGEARVLVTGASLVSPREAPVPALAAGETTQVVMSLNALHEGRAELVASVGLVGDESPENDRDTLRVRVGAGPLELTEVQFHPLASEGEWVEVRNHSGAPLALESFRMGDRAGAGGRIADGPPLAADSLAVLAQDPVALLMAFPSLASARVRRVTPWAALNNTDDASGVADQVVLADLDGVPVERVSYSGAGIAAGVTLERNGESWRPSANAGGTPLSPPREPEAVPGGFRADPRRLASGHDVVHFAWELPWSESHVTLELYDLDGRRTRRLAGPLLSGLHGERPIALEVSEPGLYLAVLRAESAAGSLTRVAALRVDGPQP